jgi:spermidine synthase
MMLDNCFMLTAKGNDQYHDKCISLATTDKKGANVLIIGGGDFGLVKSLFKKIDIKKLYIVEIDEKVIDVSMEFFPDFFKLSKKAKEKITITIDDGYDWVKNNKIAFDIIIIDCTDPNPIAKKLYSKRFYQHIYKSLNKKGILIQQSGSPYLNKKDIINPTISKLSTIGFTKITLNTFGMPIYPLGTWSFIKCKKAR